ncbi:hypothetical protein ACRS9K_18155 [Burkholderia cenocepacia]
MVETLRFPDECASGATMTERQPEGPRVRLLDLIDAMRKLRSALRHDDRRTPVVTDARGAALAILADDGVFVSVNRSAAALFGYTTAELWAGICPSWRPRTPTSGWRTNCPRAPRFSIIRSRRC